MQTFHWVLGAIGVMYIPALGLDCSNAAAANSVACQLLQGRWTAAIFAAGPADSAQSHGCWLSEQEL